MSENQNIEAMLEKLGHMAYGHSRTAARICGACVSCGEMVGNFKDELSMREYSISGLCQKCQDEFFAEEEQ